MSRIAGVLGPVVFITSWLVAGAIRDGYDPVHDAISRLAELGAPNRWIVTSGMVVFGAAMILFSRVLPRPIRWLAVVAGVASLGVAAFPCTEGCPGMNAFTDIAHVLAAAVHYMAFVALAFFASKPLGLRIVALGAGLVLLTHGSGIGPNGALQRLGLTTLDAWMVVTAFRPELVLGRRSARTAPKAGSAH